MTETIVGLIGGSGTSDLLKDKKVSARSLGRSMTPFGESQEIFELDGPVYLLARRGEFGSRVIPSAVNYRANIWALKEYKVNSLLSWSGVGSINLSYELGDIVIVDDLIDATTRRDLTYFTESDIGGMPQNPVFCPDLSVVLCDSLQEEKVSYHFGGTYVCTEGPRLPTPGEIRQYGSLGVDVIGQTLCPEVFLAKELEICYHPIIFITNYAEGIRRKDFREQSLFADLGIPQAKNPMSAIRDFLPLLVEKIVPRLKEIKPACRCRSAMKKYKDRGYLDEDFRNWIK